MPIIDSLGLRGPDVLSVTAQIAVADTACIVLLPLVIDVRRVPAAALGALAVAALAAVFFALLRAVDRRGRQEHLLAVGEPAALMFGALLTIAATSITGALAARGAAPMGPPRSRRPGARHRPPCDQRPFAPGPRHARRATEALPAGSVRP